MLKSSGNSRYDVTLRSPSLHEAVRRGDLASVSECLKNGSDVNEVDTSGNTALLLAACIGQKDVYTAIVGSLIEKGADVNAYNKGFTPLYNAVFYKRAEAVEMLLKAGAWLRPTYRNELHLLAEIGGSNILRLLLADQRCTPEVINRPEEDGRTALHIAAQFCHKNCLRMLIDKGGDLSATNLEGESVADVVFEQIVNPEKFITEILDNNISIEQVEKYKYNANVDFAVLAPKTSRRQMEVISSLLVAASEDEKIEVLQHPLIELYLILKWDRICYFFYFWIFGYFVFAVSMGIHGTLIIHNYNHQHFNIPIAVTKYLVILTSSGLLAHAILQCILVRRNYFQRYEIWMNLICTCLSLTVAVTANDVNRSEWVLHITSIAVLLAWIELMLLIGRLPSLGHYALMFSAVLQNVVKVLLAFVCLLIGFTLSFSILFHNHNLGQFSDPWRSLVKTTVMMMGEFEYGDLYLESAESSSLLPATSRVVFFLFIILTSIVLMNLMVGVAVSDIQELQRRGSAKKLEKQAEFLCQLEKVISSRQLNSKYVPAVIKRIFLRRSFVETTYKVRTCNTFRRTQKIPRRLIDSIMSIAKGHNQVPDGT
ncbi:unnamed protein product [Phaedon cochleariae]|uniref:Ion transport domain-containing protein n=1 Tax=Phaedon cochleariae TaxID=80249 RepID=A0A9N9X381_PHACE|nr:unnamed protein product [Phaedon cochleariae]